MLCHRKAVHVTIDTINVCPQDLGQKNFGHVTCKVCGMVYTSGQPADQAEHLHFHKNYLSGINFPVSLWVT